MDEAVPLVFLLVVGAVLVVVIWQVFATWRAKALLAREESYRQLTEKMVGLTRETQEEIYRLNESLQDVQRRMISIEKVMTEIE